MNICIVARKNLKFNTRIVRQAFALEQVGHDVTVVCLAPPSPEQVALTPKTRYITVVMPFYLLRKAVMPVYLLRKAVMPVLRGNLRRIWNVLRRRPAKASSPGMAGAGTGNEAPKGGGRSSTGQGGGEVPKSLKNLLRHLGRTILSVEFSLVAVLLLFRKRFDLVQAHDSVSLPASAKLSARSGCRMVYDAVELPGLDSLWSYRQLPSWVVRLESSYTRRLLTRAGGIMTVGSSIADWFSEKLGKERPEVIRNCRLSEIIAPSQAIRRDCGLARGQRLVLYLNSLYPGQGLEQLVESTALLPEDVHVATQGPIMMSSYEVRLRGLIEKHGVGDRFHILGAKSPGEMLSYASGADIGVIPRQNTCLNNYYSLPNRVFELTMARLPFAVPDFPDMREFVETYGVGMAFDETDPRDIARVLVEMLEPPLFDEMRAASAKAAVELCWENEGKRYVGFLERVAGGGLEEPRP